MTYSELFYNSLAHTTAAFYYYISSTLTGCVKSQYNTLHVQEVLLF